ncbi:MAG: DUF2330 domain-containing protein [Candidatus Micrarchaeota archaeon]
MRAAVLLLILLFSGFATADGGAWIRMPDRWQIHPESQQYAIIDYNDGYERLGLTVEFAASSQGTNAIWVVPIPASPTKVDIKLIDGFPIPTGSSISEQSRNIISSAALSAAVWGTFPLALPLGFLFIFRGTLSGASMKADGMYGSSYYDGISIFQRVSLGGVTSDLVATKDPAELERYLSSKGVELAGEYKMILEKYVDKDYSFVVTYISDWQKFQSSKTSSGAYDPYGYGSYGAQYPSRGSTTPISLRIGFPSEKPYFPLKLTSMYGDRVIPITLYMIGNYKPKLYSGIGGGVKADYFRNGNVNNYYRGSAPSNTEEFFRPGRTLSNLDFTKITINEPSINFKDDLWFDSGLPISFGLKKVIADNFWVVLILMMAICSAVASIAAGRVIFKDGSVDDAHLAMHSLWNFTTMIGFVLATFFWNTQKLDEKTAKQLSDKGLSVYDGRKISYTVLFYILFVIAVVILWMLLSWVAG